MIIKQCLACGVAFTVKPYRSETAFYCSHKCGRTSSGKAEKCSVALKGRCVNPRTTFKKGHRQSEESRRKMSIAKKGKESANKKPDVFISCAQCGIKKKIRPGALGKMKCCSKPCADKYKDKGKTPEAQKIRMSREYKEWREAVFNRDDWTCQICGDRGGELNADHIKKFADFPDIRFDVDNGRTLCRECHLMTPTFGRGRKMTTLF